jgi:hypothetical protein
VGVEISEVDDIGAAAKGAEGRGGSGGDGGGYLSPYSFTWLSYALLPGDDGASVTTEVESYTIQFKDD